MTSVHVYFSHFFKNKTVLHIVLCSDFCLLSFSIFNLFLYTILWSCSLPQLFPDSTQVHVHFLLKKEWKKVRQQNARTKQNKIKSPPHPPQKQICFVFASYTWAWDLSCSVVNRPSDTPLETMGFPFAKQVSDVNSFVVGLGCALMWMWMCLGFCDTREKPQPCEKCGHTQVSTELYPAPKRVYFRFKLDLIVQVSEEPAEADSEYTVLWILAATLQTSHSRVS